MVEDPRFLRVAIVGEPNAGKSTLLNSILGAPLSAVSRKYNTTRDRVLGVHTEGRTQVAFTDTPGFMLPGGVSSGRFQRTLVAVSRSSVPSNDLVLLVVDIARRMTPDMVHAMEDMVRLCGASGVPVVVAANKCDLVKGVPLSQEQMEIWRGRQGMGGEASSINRPDLLALKALLLGEWLEGACTRSGLLGEGGFKSPHIWRPAPGAAVAGAGAAGAAAAEGNTLSSGPSSTRLHGGKELMRAPSPYFTHNLPSVAQVAAGLKGGGQWGVGELLASIKRVAPPRQWEHSRDMMTDRAPVEVVADAVRGRIFEWLHEEVPYRVTQETRSWREVPLVGDWEKSSESSGSSGSGKSLEQALLIHQDIKVPSSRVAGMLLARGGEPIKGIALAAARDAGKVLGRKVYLQLHVTVRSREEKEEA